MDEMLRDRLVYGISKDNIQRRLLSKAKLTYEKALELVHSLEAAMKSAKEIQSTSANQKEESAAQNEQVHQLQSEVNHRGRHPCYRCRGTNHVPSQCCFIGKHCFNCGKLGHTARVCHSKNSTGTQQQSTRNPVRVVQMDSPEYVEPNDEYSLNKVTSATKESPPQKPCALEVDVIVEGKKLVVELDTRAAVSLVS